MFATYRNYIRPLESAGAITVILSPEPSQIRHYVDTLDGLFLTGGDDIHPKYFGQRKKSVPMKLSPDKRTIFEIKMARTFVRKKKPFLGLCLGAQTLNVALGGTIIQDLRSQKKEAYNHKMGTHRITLAKNSRLKNILRRDALKVNTNHHQAIDRVGRNLRAVAWSGDGVIEAIEGKGRGFALGIQWHPEEMKNSPSSKKLFSAFVRSCR